MARRALVVIDMINTYDHEDAERPRESAKDVVPVIADLLKSARESDAPVIYVNDNFGEWRSDHRALLEEALAGEYASLIEPIVPDDEAMFVVKARHSIFFETPLGYLVDQKGIDRLILAGQVTEQCILYSALDAYVRHLEVSIPTDAVAHIYEDLAEAALKMMERNMRAELVSAADCRLEE